MLGVRLGHFGGRSRRRGAGPSQSIHHLGHLFLAEAGQNFGGIFQQSVLFQPLKALVTQGADDGLHAAGHLIDLRLGGFLGLRASGQISVGFLGMDCQAGASESTRYQQFST